MQRSLRSTTLGTFVLLALVTLGLASCGNDDLAPNIQLRDAGNAQEAILTSPYDQRIEVPARKAGNTFVAHTLTHNGHEVMNYCLEYDPTKFHARWVACRFDGDTRTKNVSRTNAWDDDPQLPANLRVGTGGFYPYDRGHLCASYDRLFSTTANEQTFYMSNMSPQIGNFNSPYWSTLEGIVQSMGRNEKTSDKNYANFADTLYVVKGGYIDDDSDIMGYVTRSSTMRIAVPRHYFMALLRLKGNTYNSIAFWLEHKDYGMEYVPTDTYQKNNQIITVDRLEELTGIDFFHNLPDNIENQVESTYSLNLWL